MMTKKHLQALAEALADVLAAHGADEPETVTDSMAVIEHLRRSGGVTEHFDPARFEAAVRAAYRGE